MDDIVKRMADAKRDLEHAQAKHDKTVRFLERVAFVRGVLANSENDFPLAILTLKSAIRGEPEIIADAEVYNWMSRHQDEAHVFMGLVSEFPVKLAEYRAKKGKRK